MLAHSSVGRVSRPCAGPRAHPHITKRTWVHSNPRRCVTAQAEAGDSSSSGEGAADIVHDVVELRGMRVSLEQSDPVVEYRVQWKDGSPDTWELATNISPDLVRDFDERWWTASKKADYDTMSSMLSYGREVLSQVVDENRRSALHFASAVGATRCVRLLLDAGADPDLQDREGYTPLHMAAGYMQLEAMAVLLEAGADPELQDKEGRDVVSLVERLRGQMPPNPALLQRRLALEQVANVLVDRLYDEVEVESILEEREGLDGETEYLVQFKDGGVDAWLPARDVAPDIVADWEASLERGEVSRLLDMQQFGTERQFLVQWADGAQDSWEPEEHVPAALIEAFQEQRPDLFKQAGGRRRRKRRAKKAAAAQQAAAAAGAEKSADAAMVSASSSAANGASNGLHAVTHGEPAHQASSSSSSSSSAGNSVAAAPVADSGHAAGTGLTPAAVAAVEQAGHAQQSAQGSAAGQAVEATADRELLAAGAQKR